jgi:hypothetical protein
LNHNACFLNQIFYSLAKVAVVSNMVIGFDKIPGALRALFGFAPKAESKESWPKGPGFDFTP